MSISNCTTVETVVLRGDEINTRQAEIVQFLDENFRKPPYEYVFTTEQWNRYVGRYANQERSIVVLAVENNKILGIVTGLPLAFTSDKYKNGFCGTPAGLVGRALTQTEFESTYYLGDLAVDETVQHRGIATRIYNIFEKTVCEQKQWSRIVFWQMQSLDNKPVADFSRKLGYQCPGDLWFDEKWIETNGQEMSHRMMGWVKQL